MNLEFGSYGYRSSSTQKRGTPRPPGRPGSNQTLIDRKGMVRAAMSLREIGLQAIARKDYAGAVEPLRQALLAQPNDPQVLACLGAAYQQLGQPIPAEQCLREMVRLAPRSAPAQFNLGAFLARQGRNGEAAACFEQALALDPNYERARQGLATVGGAGTAAAPGGWSPAPSAGAPAPPQGLQPLGDWTPPPAPPPPPPPTANDWTPAPRPAAVPSAGMGSAAGSYGDGVVHSVTGEGSQVAAGEKGWNCFKIGAHLGLGWGGIGALICFLSTLATVTSSWIGEAMPETLLACFLFLVVGAFLYGMMGWLGSTVDDPGALCGWLGIAIGVLLALANHMGVTRAIGFGYIGMAGSIFISWKFGAVLGARLNEYMAQALVVTG
ncbi:MAG: tetratricopeptide repeat protein, partial [Armatimonadetes bacterium]|nr:tetratricopeptide repeat protein [Armatimonadota bacterium]